MDSSADKQGGFEAYWRDASDGCSDLDPKMQKMLKEWARDAWNHAPRSSCAASERQRHLALNVIYHDHHLGQEEVRELARAVLALPESEATVAFHKLLQDEGEEYEGPDSTPQPEAPTPRVNKMLYCGRLQQNDGWWVDGGEWVRAEDARQLERELAEALHWKEVYFQSNAEARAPLSASAEPVAWLIEYKPKGADPRRAVHLHNAVADYPDAKAIPLYAAPRSSTTPSEAEAAILEHNRICEGACDHRAAAGVCAYREPLKDGKLIYPPRRCPECPTEYKIEWPRSATAPSGSDNSPRGE